MMMFNNFKGVVNYLKANGTENVGYSLSTIKWLANQASILECDYYFESREYKGHETIKLTVEDGYIVWIFEFKTKNRSCWSYYMLIRNIPFDEGYCLNRNIKERKDEFGIERLLTLII